MSLVQVLPTLVYTFVFSLFTAVALRPVARGGYAACITWCTVNMLLEAGQHQRFSAHLAALLHRGGLRQQLANYLLRGDVDLGEMLAAASGVLLAAVVLRVLRRHLGPSCQS